MRTRPSKVMFCCSAWRWSQDARHECGQSATHARQLRFLDKVQRGLSAVYEADQDGKWAFFEPLEPIEGFPAVAYDILDDRDIGNCTVVVGVSDGVAFEADVTQSSTNVGQSDPCEAARREWLSWLCRR